MKAGRAVLLTTIVLALSTSGALAISCKRPTSRVDHAVCASPALRRADAAMGSAYSEILDATLGRVKAGFIAQQKAWLQYRDATCRAASSSCLIREYGIRQAQLDSLLARVGWGEMNFLDDTTPLLLAGSWKASPPKVLPGQGTAPVDLESAARGELLPRSDTIVTGQPGKLCYGPRCFDAGLQASQSTAFFGNRQAALGLQPTARTYLLILTKWHMLDLVAGRQGTLRVLFDACAPLHTNCVVAEQVWVPQDGHAAILNMLDQGNSGHRNDPSL